MICGMRRSGSTLLTAVLCSDPRAHPPQPETQILTRIVEAYAWSDAQFETFGQPFFADRAALRASFAGACRSFLANAEATLGAKGLLVLKHPRLSKSLAAFRQLLPEARIVVTVRDPRDQVASELEVDRRAGQTARRGVRSHAAALRDWFAEPPGLEGASVVRYEDLVGDFDAVRTRLEAELELNVPFDPAGAWPELAALDPLRRFPAWSPKYGGRIDAQSVGRFRADLSRDQIAEIEATGAALMERFGYAPEARVR